MKRTRKARSRAQRAFFAWLDEAAPRFKIALRVEKRTDREVQFSFAGITPLVNGCLIFRRSSEWRLAGEKYIRMKTFSHGELIISADRNGECWDVMVWEEASPVKVPTGYICHECLPQYQSIFPDRESLWHDHLFEPLLDWVNTQLAEAEAVGLYQTPGGGVRWAKLLPAGNPGDPECLVTAVPLRLDGRSLPP